MRGNFSDHDFSDDSFSVQNRDFSLHSYLDSQLSNPLNMELSYRAQEIEKNVYPVIKAIGAEINGVLSHYKGWKKESFLSVIEKLPEPCFFEVSLLSKTGSKEAIGFVFISKIDNEAEILRYAIKKRFQRKGLGLRLLEFSFLQLIEKGVEVVTLEVSALNTAALSHYRKSVFHQVGVRKNYYTHPRSDAIMMSKDLSVESS